MNNVIPELRGELLRAAERQARAGARARRSRIRGLTARGPLFVAIAALSMGGVAAATGLIVSQATKDRSKALVREPSLSQSSPGESSRVGEQMVRAAAEIRAGLPYPPGMADDYDWSKYKTGATLGTNSETRRELALQIEYRAACLWRIYWLQAYDDGDSAAMADAAEILSDVPSWPATRTVRMAGSEQVDSAAARGDAETMRLTVDRNCTNIQQEQR